MAELESSRFGDSPELMDELLELVLRGKKTATCWAASEGDKGVAIGKRWIVKDGQGRRERGPGDRRAHSAAVRRGRRGVRI